MTGERACPGALGRFGMKWLSRLTRWVTSARALCVVLLFALIFLRITNPAALEELRLRAFDIFQVIQPREATQRPVVIVDIDEASLRKLGQFPWPRTRIADMITRLTDLGAAAIGFDIIFSEPDRLSPALAADAIPRSGRRDAEQAARAAKQRPGHGRCNPAIESGARRNRLAHGPTGARGAASRRGRGGPGWRSKALHVQFPGASAKRSHPRKRRRGPRVVQYPHGTRRHRKARTHGHDGAGQPHAFAVIRDAEGRHRRQHHIDQNGRGRHQGHRHSRLRNADRSKRPALGAFCTP